RYRRPPRVCMMRTRGSSSASCSASSVRFSDWRSIRLPAKPTNWLGSRSGAPKRENVMKTVVLSGKGCLDAGDKPVEVLAAIGLALAVPPHRTGPARIAFGAGDEVDVQLRHDVSER